VEASNDDAAKLVAHPKLASSVVGCHDEQKIHKKSCIEDQKNIRFITTFIYI
jgi:hypothetical protein